MSRFNECLHGDLAEIGDTGNLTDAELRALVQNLCDVVARLQTQGQWLEDKIAQMGNTRDK